MQIQSEAESTSWVSRNVVIDGQIDGEENLKVDGRITGELKIKGNLIVGVTGVIEADVEADNIIVEGQIKGTVLARGHLEIQSTGNMIGDISARSIDIKEGSTFEGRSHMLKSKAPVTPPSKKKAADRPEEISPATPESGK